jgi:hypothetical protein
MHRLPIASSLLVLLLASCGGGGGGGATPQASSPAAPGPAQTAASISGYIVEGPVSGATVKLYQLDTSGNKTLLGSAVSNAAGFYSIPNTAPAGTAILVEATGGSYTDDLSRQTLVLPTPLRAVSISGGAAARVSVTPYSEAAVRMAEHLPQPDWSATRIAGVNKRVADVIAVSELLDFTPVDLKAGAPEGSLRDNNFVLSVFTSGFSAYAHRFDASPSASLDGALDGLRRMFSGEEHDDRVLPAFIGGIADFLDASAVSDLGKRTIKTSLLSAGGNASLSPMSDDQLRKLLPAGVSSGGVTAPMPNDAFQVVGTAARGSVFNYRGALVGYPLDDGSGLWRVPYMASVAEVYGDGDIGIGRWNGGTTYDATRSGGQLVRATTAQPLAAGSWHYAVARPLANLPACGMRKLVLVAQTTPTRAPGLAGGMPAPLGLTADSSIAFQYGDRIRVGFDIGVAAADGSVTRYGSSGGVLMPWASPSQIDPRSAGQLNETLYTGSTALEVKGLVSGSGANKFVAKLSIGTGPAAIEFVAAFAAPGGADSSGCAVAAGDPGQDISPPPAPGGQYVFAGADGPSTYTSTPVSAQFGPRGELTATDMLQSTANTSVFDLAGNADASIGRIDGEFVLRGTLYRRSMPYGVARPGAVVPASGSRHYVLIASTAVAPDVEQVPGVVLGKVQSASLDINFGENPIGTPNARDGTAKLRVDGMLGDVPFAVASAYNGALPSEALFSRYSSMFIIHNFEGALAAPNGDYATVRFTTRAKNGVPVSGALLFRAE